LLIQTSGNFPTVTRVLLTKIPADDDKKSYVYDNHVFHYVVDDSIIYLCMVRVHQPPLGVAASHLVGFMQADGQERRIPFAFLEDVKNRFK
jgi:vesicle-associated membrane protein 7